MKPTGLSPRRWIPRVHYDNFGDPSRRPAFRKWFHVSRYWSGRIWTISVRHHSVTFDFRGDWLSDMANAKAKRS